MSIKPIETRYAGHRFRSRLEARWAVFFDTLGLHWEYEPQGYLVGPERKPYLPDFWLPKERLWVEVKGSEEHLDVELLVHAASLDTGLPRAAEPHVVNEHEARLLVLGPHGRGVHGLIDKASKEHVGYVLPIHTALTVRKGDMFQSHAWFSQHGVTVDPTQDRIADDSVDIDWEGRGHRWGNLVGGGGMISEGQFDEAVIAAYRSAISARFEHGQSGA